MRSAPRLVSIVVPTYNERRNLAPLVEGIADALPWPYEVIVVDDSSPDGTGELARMLARSHPIVLVSRPQKRGIGSAYRDGFAAARGDVVVQMDADLSHDPADVPELVCAVVDGADLAVGSRYVAGGHIAGWGPYRHLVSGVANTMARAMLRVGVRDVTTGFRAYAAAAARTVELVRCDGYAFEVEALHVAKRAGLRIVEVPIHFEDRAAGQSKLGVGEYARFVRTIARLRFSRSPLASRRPARAS